MMVNIDRALVMYQMSVVCGVPGVVLRGAREGGSEREAEKDAKACRGSRGSRTKQ